MKPETLFEEEDLCVFELMGQLMGSPGGKKLIAGKIVKRIPEHKTYVEPYCGGAAVYFRKPKESSQREVLNDLDKNITNCFLFVKNAGEAELKKAGELCRELKKKEFYAIRDRVLKTPVEDTAQGFADFYSMNYSSFACDRDSYGYVGRDPQVGKRLGKLHERLKDTIIENMDAIECIKKYDSPDTFFYLDPPYPKTWRSANGYGYEDVEKMAQALVGLKGKFLLSIGKDPKVYAILKKHGLKTSKMKTARCANNRKDAGGRGVYSENEYVAYNYELSEDHEMERLPEFPERIVLEEGYKWGKEGFSYELCLVKVVELREGFFDGIKPMKPEKTFSEAEKLMETLIAGAPYVAEKRIEGPQCFVYLKNGAAIVKNSKGKDISSGCKEVLAEVKKNFDKDCILEGVLTGEGEEKKLHVTDVLHYDDQDCIKLEWYERKKVRDRLKYGDKVLNVESTVLTKENFGDEMKRLGISGAFVKRADAAYKEGENPNVMLFEGCVISHREERNPKTEGLRKDASKELMEKVKALSLKEGVKISENQIETIALMTQDTKNVYYRSEIAQAAGVNKTTVFNYQKMLGLL